MKWRLKKHIVLSVSNIIQIETATLMQRKNSKRLVMLMKHRAIHKNGKNMITKNNSEVEEEVTHLDIHSHFQAGFHLEGYKSIMEVAP
jgi:hypothetical protein